MLAEALGQCPSLTFLGLSNNDIGAEGAGRLAEVLGQCRSLAHLDLCHNDIGAEGAGRMVGALEQCGRCCFLPHDSAKPSINPVFILKNI